MVSASLPTAKNDCSGSSSDSELESEESALIIAQADCLLDDGDSTLNLKGDDEGRTSSGNGHVGEGASRAILNCNGTDSKDVFLSAIGL